MEGRKKGKKGTEGEKKGRVTKVWSSSNWKHYAAVFEILKARKGTYHVFTHF